MSGRSAAGHAIALIAAVLTIGVPALANDAAHSMAERFAGADQGADRKTPSPTKSQAAPKAKAAPAADDPIAQTLQREERARREREAAEARARAKAAKEAAEAKRAVAAKAARAASDARRAAEEQRSAEEADMLARARREAEEQAALTEESRLTAEARRLIEEAERERAKAEALLAGRKPPETSGENRRESIELVAPSAPKAAPKSGDEDRPELARDADAAPNDTATAERRNDASSEPTKLAQQRAEETRRLAEKLKRVRQIREARLAGQKQRETPEVGVLPPPSEAATPAVVAPPPASHVETAARAPTPQPPKAAEDDTARAAPSEPTVLAEASRARETSAPVAIQVKAPAGLRETRVTVLLILEPGTYGIRRNGPKVADPVLCTLEGCYVSTGMAQPARFFPGRKALSFGNTWGGRAGACRQSLGCIFREVELGQVPGYLQPVDLHILKHDRRRGQVITSDSGCAFNEARLTCSQPIYADDYVMWVLPESLADAIGPAALESALRTGLSGPRSAHLIPPRR